jgi:NAD(P)H dehydrogenase (quinone)
MTKLLITGASGPFGQRALHHLLNTLNVPASNIIAISRKPEALAGWAAQGVTVRAGDFEDAASLAAAFAGAERLLLISTDAVDRPGRRIAQHKAAVDAAVTAGVKHVVYTSMPRPEGSPILIAPDHAATEAALAASTLPGWTVLRNHWYFENLLASLPHVVASGQWFTAAGDGKIANIARDDLARAAAVALAGTAEGKTTLTLGGDTPRTTAEIAALVSEVTGKPIQVIQISVEDLVKGIVGAGLPEPIARLIASFDTNTAAGRAGDVTGDFRALTGVDPLPFEQWLATNQAALLGQAAA